MSRVTTRQLPKAQVTTEQQRLNRKRREALRNATEAERRGNNFQAEMYRREAARYKTAADKANGQAPEPTRDIVTAVISYDYAWRYKRSDNTVRYVRTKG